MRSRGVSSALLALPTLASAVSLADLAPRAMNLPEACQIVYTSQIPGCTPHDFISMTCSEQCIAGLESLVRPIEQACGNQGVSGENLVVAFLVGVGPAQICHNAPPSSGSGLPPGAPQSLSEPWTSTTPASSSSTPQTTITSGTSTASSASPTLSSLLVDTTSLQASSSAVVRTTQRTQQTRESSATPTTTTTQHHHGLQRPTPAPDPQVQTISSASAATTSGSAYGQTHSGSGSPFDLADSAAGNAAASMMTLSLALGFALLQYIR